MKKFVILIGIILLMSGCVRINNNYSTLIDEAIKSNKEIYNTYRNGYKFYLPRGMYVEDSREYNEIIKSKDNRYYLFIDLIGYLNKEELSYKENTSSVFSKAFSYNNKYGFIEINKKNKKYLVEIMYNYAKIEVIVNEEDLDKSVANAITLLASIHYNDNILKNMSNDNIMSYSNTNINIFKKNGKDTSRFLEYSEEYEYNDEESNQVPDYDVIK